MVGRGQLSRLAGPTRKQESFKDGVWEKPELPHGMKEVREKS